jgi:nicotinate-nucleotide--dimethylbenzimidazole phosphoribosyltransferase
MGLERSSLPASPQRPALEQALRTKLDLKTKPQGSLGRLEELGLRLGLRQETLEPRVIRPQALIFAADHGAAAAGLSAFPQAVTGQMVHNFLSGGAAVCVLCRQFDVELRVIDAGVIGEFGAQANLVAGKVAHGTRNYLEEPAMSAEQVQQAINLGRRCAEQALQAGSNVLALGEMGIGNTAAAALLSACLLPAPLEPLVGRGTGLDDAGLARKRRLLGAALERGGRSSDPLLALAEYGGFEIAALCGAILAGARGGALLVIDGFIVTAATLVAWRLEPAILDACVFAHRSQEAGHRLQLETLGVRPLFDLDLRLGEGSGAVLAVPLLRAAAAILNEMASFDQAGVDTKIG